MSFWPTNNIDRSTLIWQQVMRHDLRADQDGIKEQLTGSLDISASGDGLPGRGYYRKCVTTSCAHAGLPISNIHISSSDLYLYLISISLILSVSITVSVSISTSKATFTNSVLGGLPAQVVL